MQVKMLIFSSEKNPKSFSTHWLPKLPLTNCWQRWNNELLDAPCIIEWMHTHAATGTVFWGTVATQYFVSWSCQTILVSPWQHASHLISYFSWDRNCFPRNLHLFTKWSHCNSAVSTVSAPVAAFYLIPLWFDLLILESSLDKSTRITS